MLVTRVWRKYFIARRINKLLQLLCLIGLVLLVFLSLDSLLPLSRLPFTLDFPSSQFFFLIVFFPLLRLGLLFLFAVYLVFCFVFFSVPLGAFHLRGLVPQVAQQIMLISGNNKRIYKLCLRNYFFIAYLARDYVRTSLSSRMLRHCVNLVLYKPKAGNSRTVIHLHA